MAKRDVTYSLSKPQQHVSLTDIAYNVLLEAIMNQDFPPGALVSIDGLARELNMSITPVREALMRAHGQRLVVQKTNHGFAVANVLKPDEIAQLFEVRHLLETQALTTGEITPDVAETAATIVKRMKMTGDGTVYGDYQDYLLLDHQFHRVLVELSGNHFLIDTWEDLHVHLHLSRLYKGVGLFDRTDSTSEHQAILEALQQGNKISAVQLLSQHIQRVGSRMQHFLEK